MVAVDGRPSTATHGRRPPIDARARASTPSPPDTEITLPGRRRPPRTHVGRPPATATRWSRPFGPIGDDRSHPLFFTYSLMLATFLGTMGLPHILVRFYTNPDGRAARQTTLIVLVLLGAFYVFPAVYGVLGPPLHPGPVHDRADRHRGARPARAGGRRARAASCSSGLVAAGAFAAFLSTASGLLDLGGRGPGPGRVRVRVRRVPAGGGAGGRGGAWSSGCGVERVRHQPARRLGLRHRRLVVLPAAGARHLVAGPDRAGRRGRHPGRAAALASAAILVTMAGWSTGGWPEALLGQPAAWSVPLAFLTMVVVSKPRARRCRARSRAKLLRFHLPEPSTAGRTVRPSIAPVPPSVGPRS